MLAILLLLTPTLIFIIQPTHKKRVVILRLSELDI
jgi:hypothetical protein